MRRVCLAVLLAAVFVPVAEAAGPIPAQITRARYVALGYDTGGGFVSELQAIGNVDLVHPDDLVAVQNLREQLESWGHYIVTTHPQQAELLFVVRTGRRVAMGGAVRSGAGGSNAGLQSAQGGRVEISSGDDMLSIYDAQRGTSTAPLWRERQAAGRGFPGKLFDQLKQQVEAAPPPAPKKP